MLVVTYVFAGTPRQSVDRRQKRPVGQT